MKNKILALFSIFLLGLASVAHAGEWYTRTTFSSKLEVDDNKRLRSSDEKGVTGVDGRVGIELSNVTEISEVYVKGALRSVRYDGDDDRGVDTDDQLFYAGGRWNGERSQLTVDGEFLRQSSQFTELRDTGFLEDVNRRVDKGIRSQYSYLLFEDTHVFVGGNYNKVEFPNSIPVSLTEYDVKGLNTGVVYNFDEYNYATFTVFHSDYEADTFVSDVETNGASLRYDKTFNETWSGFAEAGYRKSNFKNAPGGVIRRDDDTGSSYDIGVLRTTEVSTFSVEFSNSLEPSADGDVNERREVSLAYNRSFSERLSSRALFDYFKDESVNISEDADREYWTVLLGADYRVTPNWYLTGYVRHRDQENKGITTDDAESNAAIIGIRYNGNKNRI